MKFIILTLILVISPGITYAKISHKAKVALRLQDYNKAHSLLKPQAKRGNADAQYHLALLYKSGKGVKKNNKTAFYWFKKSADKGNVRAQYNCGVIFENGYGVKTSYKKALHWYKMAAQKGHQKSIAKLDAGFSTTKNIKSSSVNNLFAAIKNKKTSKVKTLLHSCSNINKKIKIMTHHYYHH